MLVNRQRDARVADARLKEGSLGQAVGCAPLLSAGLHALEGHHSVGPRRLVISDIGELFLHGSREPDSCFVHTSHRRRAMGSGERQPPHNHCIS